MGGNTQYLMKSTSGVRGVIGPGINPVMVTEYGAAFGAMLRQSKGKGVLVVGRDSRPSGGAYAQAVIAGARAAGMNVVDIGIAPTPTVAMAILGLKAKGGVCVTASHNPGEWNALKFFNRAGEFIDKATYLSLECAVAEREFGFVDHKKFGGLATDSSWIERHISSTCKAPAVDVRAIKRARLKIVVDAVNGAGSDALPLFLEKLGCRVIRINCIPDGRFPHQPEPVAKNLAQLCRAVKKNRADLGLACDPDADRLAVVDEKGHAIGEELTLALGLRQSLSVRRSPVAINLSTSRVSHDAAAAYGVPVYYAPVGEANVVTEMRLRRSLVGGEGNGGMIYGPLHYGRDSLIAAGLILSLLANWGAKKGTKSERTMSGLVDGLPKYYNVKSKGAVPLDFDSRLATFESVIRTRFGEVAIDRRDGVRLDFEAGWTQIRKSNTEPIYRIIVETSSAALTKDLLTMAQEKFA